MKLYKYISLLLVAFLMATGLTACSKGDTKTEVACDKVSAALTKAKSALDDANEELKGAESTGDKSDANDAIDEAQSSVDSLTKRQVNCKSDSAPADSSLDQEAAAWVKAISANFPDLKQIPAKCQSWEPKVNLTQAHYYVNDPNKESTTAFGQDMGNNPCDVSINIVERLYRDPSLVLEEATKQKVVKYKPEDRAKLMSDLEADATKRQQLANKVLAVYANPKFPLRIRSYSGGYSSDQMAADGSTSDVTSSRDSTVLERTDKKGNVVDRRRLNCGLQGFKPNKPNKPECIPPYIPYEGRCVKPEGTNDPGGAGGNGSPAKQPVSENPQGPTSGAPTKAPPPVVRPTGHPDGGSGDGGAPAPTESDNDSDSGQTTSPSPSATPSPCGVIPTC